MKILLVILMVMLCALPAIGQGKVSMGVKVGLNNSNHIINWPDTLNPKSKLGMHIGVILELKFSKVGLVSEFLYSEEGYRYGGVYHSSLKSNFVYMNVPIVFKWYLPANLSIHAGPQFGLLFDHDIEVERLTNHRFLKPLPIGTIVIHDYSSSYDRFSISFCAGAEWQVNNGIGFYFRYTQGVKDISRSDGDSSAGKNQSSQFGVSYKF